MFNAWRFPRWSSRYIGGLHSASVRFQDRLCIGGTPFFGGWILLIFRFFAHHHFILITCSLCPSFSLFSSRIFPIFSCLFSVCLQSHQPSVYCILCLASVCVVVCMGAASIEKKNRFLACFSPEPKTRTHMDIEFGETHPILKCHRDYIDDKDTAIIASLYLTVPISLANIVWIARCSGLVKLMQPENGNIRTQFMGTFE